MRMESRGGAQWLAAMALAAAMAAPAAAQGWIQLPNGQLGYQTSYVTTGFFSCSHYIVVGGCTAQGNTVVLANGGSTLTITFKGITSQVIATSRGSQPYALGTFTRTTTGPGPFTLPKSAAPNAYLLKFAMNLSTVLPTPISRLVPLGFYQQSGRLAPIYFSTTNFVSIPVLPPPAPATYGALIYNRIRVPTLDLTDGDVDMFGATATVTPEPATLALLGTGLVGVGAMARRRSRRKRDDG